MTSLKVMQVLLDKKTTLSKLAKPMKVYPQVLKNVRVKDKKAAREDKEVCAAVERVEKALGNSGRILVRESGTEPVVRGMVEAESEKLCHQYADEVIAVIREKGHFV